MRPDSISNQYAKIIHKYLILPPLWKDTVLGKIVEKIRENLVFPQNSFNFFYQNGQIILPFSGKKMGKFWEKYNKITPPPEIFP